MEEEKKEQGAGRVNVNAVLEEVVTDDFGPDAFELKIKYGNRHRIITEAPMLKNGRMRNHEWTAYVQLANLTCSKAHDLFKSVMFILPACYSNRYREVVSDKIIGSNSKDWFHCKEVGWGTVNVQIEINFKDDLGIQPVRLQHMTKFTPQGD